MSGESGSVKGVTGTGMPTLRKLAWLPFQAPLVQQSMDRSVATIREMRKTVGIPVSYAAADAVHDLQETQLRLLSGEATDEQVKASLLSAVDMIRTLHIVQDTETQIITTDPR